ncbi:MAG: GNAT family N-acetyltransferase, partial [Faecalibacterium sp.]
DIRHRLNDRLLQYAGHIGYSVRPSQRKRGCATEILRLALEQCRARGIERVRISCDRYNAASARVIRANGGVPDGELFDPANGTITQRFWIDANK